PISNTLRFVAQRVKITVKRCITQHYTHTAVYAGSRLTKNTQISILFFRNLFHATIIGTFLTGYRRKDDSTGSYTLLLDARDRQTKHRTTVQFKLIQILGSGQGYHTRIVRTWREFGEIDTVLMAEKEFHSPQSGTGQGTGHFLCHILRLP